MVAVLCRSIGHEDDETLQNDFQSLRSEVQAYVDPEVLEAIVEIARQRRYGLVLERSCDRKNPYVFISNLVHGTAAEAVKLKAESERIRDEVLQPLVGPRAATIFKVCNHTAWAEQNQDEWDASQGGYLTGSAKGYKEDSTKDRIWANYHAKHMGFEDLPGLTKKMAAKLLCYHTCRFWTVQEVPETRKAYNGSKPREASFEIAKMEAEECLETELVTRIIDIQRQVRQYTHLDRLSGTMSPLALISSLMDDTSSRAEQVMVIARETCDRSLQPPLVRAGCSEAFWNMFTMCAWQEQNMVDYDLSVGGHLTGSAEGYKTQANACKSKIVQAANNLVLDDD